jgi:hypothetical protein
MFRAPEKGYKDKFIYTVQKDSEKWSRVLKKKYYLKNNNKRYAALYINIITSGDKSFFVSIDAVVSNGFSKDLEFIGVKNKKEYNERLKRLYDKKRVLLETQK